MRRRTITVVLLAAVLFAGCAGPNAGTPASDATETPSTEATETPPADATDTPTPGSSAATTDATATPTTPVSTPGSDYRTTTVELVDENGTELATVEAWIADTWTKRYTGLSDTGALRPGQGMLFVHDREGNHAYVMRNMDFPLDMVFVAENGTITTIHHAPLPEEGGGDLRQYSGRAKYVLEVPMGYTNETGVEEGDRVRVGDA